MPKETTVIEKKMRVDSQKVSFEIIKAVQIKEDEKTDITSKAKEEMKKEQDLNAESDHENQEKGELRLSGDDLLPFSSERTDEYTFTLLRDTLDHAVSYYRIQSKAKELSDKKYEGIYRVNKKTYSISRMIIHPSKNPEFVKKLSLELHFQEMHGNRWMIHKVRSRVYARFLLKKIRMQSEEQYSDYRFDE